MKHKKRLLRWLLTVIPAIAIVCVGYLEVEHRYNYGHLFGYGVHVDVLSRYASIGIPGQTQMYYAQISNFTMLPVSLDACEYVTDASGSGISYQYAVQRWEADSNSWRTAGTVDADNFCRPTPLSTVETNRVSRWIWPGMTEDVSEGEATGARVPFEQGDMARFVVFGKVGSGDDWQYAVASAAFVITDRVIHDNGTDQTEH